jgi:hypothetical protein
MANLIVTYSRAKGTGVALQLPVQLASSYRTEIIAIDAGSDGLQSTTGALSATDGEHVVDIYADSACWVDIGETPVAAFGTGRYFAAGERAQYWVEFGHKVAVTGAEATGGAN